MAVADGARRSTARPPGASTSFCSTSRSALAGRLRGLPHACQRRNLVPIIMLTARDCEADGCSGLRRAPTTTSPSPSARPSCAAASRRAAPRRPALVRRRVAARRVARARPQQAICDVGARPVELTFSEFEHSRRRQDRRAVQPPGADASDLVQVVPRPRGSTSTSAISGRSSSGCPSARAPPQGPRVRLPAARPVGEPPAGHLTHPRERPTGPNTVLTAAERLATRSEPCWRPIFDSAIRFSSP